MAYFRYPQWMNDFPFHIFPLKTGLVLGGNCFQAIQLPGGWHTLSEAPISLGKPCCHHSFRAVCTLLVQSECICLAHHLWEWRQSLCLSLLIPEAQCTEYIWLISFSRLVGLYMGRFELGDLAIMHVKMEASSELKEQRQWNSTREWAARIVLWDLSACTSLEFFLVILGCLNEDINKKV